MRLYTLLRLLWDLGQKDALGSVIRRKTNEVLGFSNEWQIVQETGEAGMGYRLRHFDNEVDVFFASPSSKVTASMMNAVKTFLKDEFGYDLTAKKDEEI